MKGLVEVVVIVPRVDLEGMFEERVGYIKVLGLAGTSLKCFLD